MDYQNDLSFQRYLAGMIESSPVKSFVSPGYDGVVPAVEVSFDGIPTEVSDDSLHGAMGYSVMSHEEGMPSHEGSPVENARGEGEKKGKKRKRDPNKPKGWISANLMYANVNRGRVKLENPDATFGDIARLLSAEYKALSPEDIEFWEKARVDDRARFEREMLSYMPPFQVTPSDGDGSIEEPMAKKPKKKKDPNAPKKNLSAWNFFSGSVVRKQVQAEYPLASSKEIMGMLSHKYKVLSEEEKAPLDMMAAADKERYQKEMEMYKGNMYQYY